MGVASSTGCTPVLGAAPANGRCQPRKKETIMNAFMWRLVRVLVLMLTFSVSLSWVIWLCGWSTWLIVALVPTALLDLWLENIKKAGSDN